MWEEGEMGRAFSPLVMCWTFSWGVAPGWYGAGPLALRAPRPEA